MATLVTGGLGFIGSHLVDYLVDVKGHTDVVVIDNLCSESSSRDYMRPDVKYHLDDIRNIEAVQFDASFDTVFHLAALARIQPSFADPLKYFAIDAFGTCKVLELARMHGARLVYAGSSSAYGGTMLNPYSFAKFTGEQACEMYAQVYGMNTVIARFFNVYGVRQPTTGPYATVVGIFEKQTSHGEPLTVTGDGEQRRDFTHVSDIVRGLSSLSGGQHHGDVYQLGTGVNYSINELAQMFGGEIQYIATRPGETRTTLADITQTTARTGWVPHAGLEEYIKAFRQRGL